MAYSRTGAHLIAASLSVLTNHIADYKTVVIELKLCDCIEFIHANIC